MHSPPIRPDPPAPNPEPAGPPPKVTGKVVGYRLWELVGHELQSLSLDAAWKAGPNHAVCNYEQGIGGGSHVPHLPEQTPHPDCMCGLYAYHDVAHPGMSSDSVYGAVLAWGRIHVHHGGFRAEYAQPILLAYDPKQSYEHVTRLQAVAGELNLPVVALDQLEQRARAHGQPVAPELRPQAPAGSRHMTLGHARAFAGGGYVAASGVMAPIATWPCATVSIHGSAAQTQAALGRRQSHALPHSPPNAGVSFSMTLGPDRDVLAKGRRVARRSAWFYAIVACINALALALGTDGTLGFANALAAGFTTVACGWNAAEARDLSEQLARLEDDDG